MRWRMRLAEFDLELKQKASASHHQPDFLSGADNNSGTEHINDDTPCLSIAAAAHHVMTQQYTGSADPTPIAYNEVVEHQQTDAFCKFVTNNITKGAARTFYLNDSRAIYHRTAYGNQVVIL